jgi:hypothetical protein
MICGTGEYSQRVVASIMMCRLWFPQPGEAKSRTDAGMAKSTSP